MFLQAFNLGGGESLSILAGFDWNEKSEDSDGLKRDLIGKPSELCCIFDLAYVLQMLHVIIEAPFHAH